MNTPTYTIRKLNHHGVETWRYEGELVERSDHFIKIEARFNLDDFPFHGLILKRDDRSVEIFFDDRWYNIFEIHDKSDDQLKCWYCNVGYPAEILADTISYRDLALDLLVYPDGKQLVLDQEDFYALNLTEEEKQKSMEALSELQNLFRAPMDMDIMSWSSRTNDI